MMQKLSIEEIIENRMISVEVRRGQMDSPIHTHDFLEILYVINGNAVHCYKGKRFSIKKGDYYFIDYNSEHRITNKSENFACFTCTFVPEFIDNALLDCAGFEDVLKNYAVNLLPYPSVDFYSFCDENEKVLEILQLMIGEYQSKEPGYLSFIRTYLLQILLLSIRKFHPVCANFDKRVTEIMEYVSAHYGENITLKDLCSRYYCSLANISILFKGQTGVSFREYLRETRIKASCRLLTDGNKSIEEVADSVGYSDTRTYRRHFKEFFGVTPLKFRKKTSYAMSSQYLSNSDRKQTKQ